MSKSTKAVLVNTSSDLEELTDHIDRAGRGAFDFEFIPERTYFPVLCLVQACVEGVVYLVDPLELSDLQPFFERIADPKITCLFHAGGQDLELVYNLSGLIPTNILDTQIAAGFAGFGYSAGYRRLLSQVLNVQIPKTESFSDWQSRPLTKAQIEYAVNDVAHLEPLWQAIEDRLKDLNRLSWALEECKVYEEEEQYKRDRTRDFMRVKGASGLDPRSLAILKTIWEWRDNAARNIDKPPRVILSDNVLLELAKRPIESFADLHKMRGIRPDQIRQHGKNIIAAIAAGKAIPDGECPSWPTGKVPSRSELLAGDFLYLMLKVLASEIDLAPEHLATRDDLQYLVRIHREGKLKDNDLPLLTGWRYEHAGHRMVNLLEGTTVRVKVARDEFGPIGIDITEER